MHRFVPLQKKDDLIEYKGTVVKTFYSQPYFTAGILEDHASEKDFGFKEDIKFAGKGIYLQEGDNVILRGEWVTDPKYGKSFEVKEFEYDTHLTPSALENYLKNNKNVKGIGPAKAKKIAAAFGDSFEEVLLNEPEKLRKAAKLSEDTIEQLRKDWLDKKAYFAVFSELQAAGITAGSINKLIEKYGNNTLNILRSRPYSIIGQVPGFAFKKVDHIARQLGLPKTDPCRIAACVLYHIEENENQGNSWIPHGDLMYRVNKDLVMDVLNAKDLINTEIDKLLEDNKLVQIDLQEQRGFASLQAYNNEVTLKHYFQQKQSNPWFNDLSTEELERLLAHEAPFTALTDEQKDAVRKFVQYNQLIITGPAGSGKSYILNALAVLCRRCRVPYVLVAPTGTAAKRMIQVTGAEAYTLHRLLGYKGGNHFTFKNKALIKNAVYLVDEASMIGASLLRIFYENIDFSGCAIVLLGDVNQIPSVDVGNVLKDAIDRKFVETIHLTKCIRQAGVLKQNCFAILSGEIHKTADEYIGNTRRKPWYRIANFPKEEQVYNYIQDLYENTLQDKLEFDLTQDVQLITPTNKGAIGTVELNKLIQNIVQRKVYKQSVPEGTLFLLHDRVIHTRNNYDLNVMNGAIGEIIHVGEKKGEYRVQYEDQVVNYAHGIDDWMDLQLCYATTTHKSQGKQFPCVIYVCSKSHMWMNTKNLFYTGVTRAMQTCIIVGDLWGMKSAVSRLDSDKRRSLLSIL